MAAKRKAPDYEKTVKKRDGLRIVDHSQKFKSMPWQETTTTPTSVSTRFNFVPGSRRMIEYGVGKTIFRSTLIDSHPNGNDEPSAQLFWHSRGTPIELIRLALSIRPSDKPWEYVDYTGWPDDVKFKNLTEKIVTEQEATGDRTFQRINTDDMSVVAYAPNAEKGLRLPQIDIRHSLGVIGVSPVVEKLLSLTMHSALEPHLKTIIAMEPEVFPAR
jgi:hypothetical protein